MILTQPVIRQNRPVNHIAFAVDDIADAVGHYSSVLGAGPFYLIDNITFDYVSDGERECAFEHSAAFGQCGPVVIELQQIHRLSPPSLYYLLRPTSLPALNHVGYVSEDALAESDWLIDQGFPLVLVAGAGEMEVRFHDARKQLGYAIEVHRRCNFIDDFFELIKSASIDWDRSDPLRAYRMDGSTEPPVSAVLQ